MLSIEICYCPFKFLLHTFLHLCVFVYQSIKIYTIVQYYEYD